MRTKEIEDMKVSLENLRGISDMASYNSNEKA
jgi:hypothetical protein